MLRFDEKQLSRLKSEGAGPEDASSFSMKTSDTEEDLKATSDTEEDFEDDLNLEEDEDDESPVEDSLTVSGYINRRDWRRVRKIYDRSKQYIFIAATLPVNGKRTAGGTLKRLFPDANWVSGNFLHRHNPRFSC